MATAKVTQPFLVAQIMLKPLDFSGFLPYCFLPSAIVVSTLIVELLKISQSEIYRF
ncbi:hypothetical protein ACE1B6_17255 [Aerosakkonemataceae cyanobacterium BLCC-F154]|uniref:Uncharacterized protein n=1 Tax=Floridaenema fluviatile BLCC-F154 TaxID=3153640 RepID=A0ABV4YDU3_9CYAN